MKTFQSDILPIFKRYLPSLVSLIDGNDFSWNKLNTKFSKKVNQRTVEYNLKGKLVVEASIYDIITKAAENDSSAIRLLDFFEQTFDKLNLLLNQDEKKIIKSKIYDLLANFDLKYLNFFGELAVLNKIIETKQHKIVGTELTLSTGKKIDFKLFDTKNKVDVLVEILNIQLKQDSHKEMDVDKFLTKRLKDKLQQKIGDDFAKVNFVLIPVIWGQYADLKPFIDYYKRNKWKTNSVFEPLAYASYSNENNEIIYKFDFVNKL